MCSVIGFFGRYNKELLNKVFFNSRIRGLHAFGYAYYNEQDLQVKKFLDYDNFVASINEDKPNKFIAHFRYSTSGDYNNQENNQPLKKQSEALVFNGVISQLNLKEMKKKFSCYFGSDNDGWVLFDVLSGQKSIQNEKMTYASIMLRENKIIAKRNEKRPLWIGSDNDAIILSSTKDILTRSGIQQSKQLESNKIYSW